MLTRYRVPTYPYLTGWTDLAWPDRFSRPLTFDLWPGSSPTLTSSVAFFGRSSRQSSSFSFMIQPRLNSHLNACCNEIQTMANGERNGFADEVILLLQLLLQLGSDGRLQSPLGKPSTSNSAISSPLRASERCHTLSRLGTADNGLM